jgi:hypothetical protein
MFSVFHKKSFWKSILSIHNRHKHCTINIFCATRYYCKHLLADADSGKIAITGQYDGTTKKYTCACGDCAKGWEGKHCDEPKPCNQTKTNTTDTSDLTGRVNGIMFCENGYVSGKWDGAKYFKTFNIVDRTGMSAANGTAQSSPKPLILTEQNHGDVRCQRQVGRSNEQVLQNLRL